MTRLLWAVNDPDRFDCLVQAIEAAVYSKYRIEQAIGSEDYTKHKQALDTIEFTVADIVRSNSVGIKSCELRLLPPEDRPAARSLDSRTISPLAVGAGDVDAHELAMRRGTPAPVHTRRIEWTDRGPETATVTGDLEGSVLDWRIDQLGIDVHKCTIETPPDSEVKLTRELREWMSDRLHPSAYGIAARTAFTLWVAAPTGRPAPAPTTGDPEPRNPTGDRPTGLTADEVAEAFLREATPHDLGMLTSMLSGLREDWALDSITRSVEDQIYGQYRYRMLMAADAYRRRPERYDTVHLNMIDYRRAARRAGKHRSVFSDPGQRTSVHRLPSALFDEDDFLAEQLSMTGNGPSPQKVRTFEWKPSDDGKTVTTEVGDLDEAVIRWRLRDDEVEFKTEALAEPPPGEVHLCRLTHDLQTKRSDNGRLAPDESAVAGLVLITRFLADHAAQGFTADEPTGKAQESTDADSGEATPADPA